MSIVRDEPNFCDVRFSYTRLSYGNRCRVCHCGHGSGCWGWHHQGGHDALVDYWANCHIQSCLLAFLFTFLKLLINKKLVQKHLLREFLLLSTTKKNRFKLSLSIHIRHFFKVFCCISIGMKENFQSNLWCNYFLFFLVGALFPFSYNVRSQNRTIILQSLHNAKRLLLLMSV